jgi:hypothetical protein
MKNIYSINHYKIFDKIILKKRFEILQIIKNIINSNTIESCLDIGTTNDFHKESSNIIIKNLKEIDVLKSISDQKIDNPLFKMNLTKSITDEFNNEEIHKMCSDLVISSATIEHVGNMKNQIKMIENIIKLSKKYFIITTPNRFYPIDFHTKLPLIHWLPKKIHRAFMGVIGLKYFSKEENLNLLSKNDIKKIMNTFKDLVEYKIENVNLFSITSNFIVIGKIK